MSKVTLSFTSRRIKLKKKTKIIAVVLSAVFSLGSTFLIARLLKGEDKQEETPPSSSAEIHFDYFEEEGSYKLLKLHEARTINFAKGGIYIRCYGQGTIKFNGAEDNKLILCAANNSESENQITDGDYRVRYQFASTDYYNRVSVYGERQAYEGSRESEDKTYTEGLTLYYSEYTDYYIPALDVKCLKGEDGTVYSFGDLLGYVMTPYEAIDAFILWPN